MRKNELVLIIDFGGQYSQLIARRVRENNVYCEIVPHHISIEIWCGTISQYTLFSLTLLAIS